jgi:cytochrome c oxidase cbb3-type subunit III
MSSHFRKHVILRPSQAVKTGSAKDLCESTERFFAALRMTPVLVVVAVVFLACKREERNFHGLPSGSAITNPKVREVSLVPGGAVPADSGPGPYDDNAYAVSQGKTLYNQYNCSGCHFQGGGGIGPPLMDADWIYGSRPENIYETIAEGRPNGMPSYGHKIVPDQIWQIAAYIRSMSGLLRKDVAPGRDDAMQVRPQEQSTQKAKPVQSAIPKSAELP